MNAIETMNLTKRFGNLIAVDHVSFSVKWNEIFGFLGPNGAGKTTTINMLITLMKPTEGEAFVADYNVVENPEEVRKRIGVVFQDPTLDRHLTGWENLWIHGRIYGIPKRELKIRIKEFLEFVELDNWANVQVKNYSGGMMRRLEIARALICNPEILFLDEPTLGLDPQTRVKIWDYIVKLKKEMGVTIFLTTHYMEEAEKLCDKVAIIDYGKIISMGTVNELKHSIGGEVVYIKTNDANYLAILASKIESEGFAEKTKIICNEILAVYTKKASETIPMIFDVAQKLKIKVAEITYHIPTLEDVFLKFTGRHLRDEKVDFFEHFRMSRMRRWRK